MLNPLHEVRDEQHKERLKKSIKENGWEGAPLVVMNEEQLITGSHRYYAVKDLEEEGDFMEQDIPTIEIEEVFEEADLDFEEIMEENDYPDINFEFGLFVEAIRQLPNNIKEKYGIDLEG